MQKRGFSSRVNPATGAELREFITLVNQLEDEVSKFDGMKQRFWRRLYRISERYRNSKVRIKLRWWVGVVWLLPAIALFIWGALASSWTVLVLLFAGAMIIALFIVEYWAAPPKSRVSRAVDYFFYRTSPYVLVVLVAVMAVYALATPLFIDSLPGGLPPNLAKVATIITGITVFVLALASGARPVGSLLDDKYGRRYSQWCMPHRILRPFCLCLITADAAIIGMLFSGETTLVGTYVVIILPVALLILSKKFEDRRPLAVLQNAALSATEVSVMVALSGRRKASRRKAELFWQLDRDLAQPVLSSKRQKATSIAGPITRYALMWLLRDRTKHLKDDWVGRWLSSEAKRIGKSSAADETDKYVLVAERLHTYYGDDKEAKKRILAALLDHVKGLPLS